MPASVNPVAFRRKAEAALGFRAETPKPEKRLLLFFPRAAICGTAPGARSSPGDPRGTRAWINKSSHFRFPRPEDGKRRKQIAGRNRLKTRMPASIDGCTLRRP